MNKKELIAKIAEISGGSKKMSAEMLEVILEAITTGILEEGEVRLSGFGIFTLVDIPARQGHNPQNGEPITIAAHKRVAFKPSKTLKEAANQ